MCKLVIGVWNPPSGRLTGSYILEMDGASEAEMLGHAIFRTEYDYIAGRKTYRPNKKLLSLIELHDYKYVPE